MAALWKGLRIFPEILLKSPQWIIDSKRTAFIFRRTRPIKLNRLNAKFPKKLKRSNFYYEVIDITDTKKTSLLELVLVQDVPGVGMRGEKIEVNRYVGYSELLLPKLAVYADSEEAQKISTTKKEVGFSSKYSKVVENFLACQLVPVFLSPTIEWTLKPWHIKLALRKIGIMTNEDCIILPEKEITGPDLEKENKDFIVKVIMNKSEVFKIRCRIFHWSGSQSALESEIESSFLSAEVLFPEEKDAIEEMIRIQKEIAKKKEITGRMCTLGAKK